MAISPRNTRIFRNSQEISVEADLNSGTPITKIRRAALLMVNGLNHYDIDKTIKPIIFMVSDIPGAGSRLPAP